MASQGKDKNGGVYTTPLEFLAEVDALWPIGWDLAASPENSAVRRLTGFVGYFTDEATDSFPQDWSSLPLLTRKFMERKWLWLNPPFSHIDPWAKKCHEECEKGARILLLAPTGTQDWNRKYCQGKSLELRLYGRMTFEGCPPNPKTGKIDPYPKDLTLFVFSRGLSGAGIWDWRKSIKKTTQPLEGVSK